VAFDFPASPTVGQKYTSGGVTYSWNGYAWAGGPVADSSTYVLKAGDAMTGPLTVPASATGSQVPRVSEVVKKSGDTMSGNLSMTAPASLGAGVPLPANLSMGHVFTGLLSTPSWFINAYQEAGSPAVNRSLNGGYSSYIGLDTSAGVLYVQATAGSVAAGASVTFQTRAQFLPTYTLLGPRVGASNTIGDGSNPALYLWNSALIWAAGWYLSANGQLSAYSFSFDGLPQGTALFTMSRYGWYNVGPGADMSFQDNQGSPALRVQYFSSNSYCYYNTATGGYVWVGGTVNSMNLPQSGNLDVTGATPTKVNAGQWAARSDERIKHEIKDFKLGLDEVLQLRPRRFKYRPETHVSCGHVEHVGFIAQEVETIMPDLVTNRGKDSLGEIELDDMRVIDITAVQFALVNAVKELKSELDAALARIAELEASHDG
jgi:Chaperone of endosialidase